MHDWAWYREFHSSQQLILLLDIALGNRCNRVANLRLLFLESKPGPFDLSNCNWAWHSLEQTTCDSTAYDRDLRAKATSKGNESCLETSQLVEESREEVNAGVFAIGEGCDAQVDLGLENMTNRGIQAFAALLGVKALEVGSKNRCGSDQRTDVFGVELWCHESSSAEGTVR